MSKNSYIPLSTKEQDVLQRMLEQDEMYVEVVGWGFHPNPTITAGDKRIQIRFPMEFTKPVGVDVPVKYFELRLKRRDGKTLASSTESTIYNNQPLYVTAGMQIDLVWDLALDRVSDELTKEVIPGIKGKRVGTIKKDGFETEE